MRGVANGRVLGGSVKYQRLPIVRHCATRTRRVHSRQHGCVAATAAQRRSLGLQDADMRAQEAHRSERLFDDPWAALLLDNSSLAVAFQNGSPNAAQSTPPDDVSAEAVATRVLDAALANAVAGSGDDAIRQVVFVGHGCDTRPFRLQWPQSSRMFELGAFDAIAHAEIAFEKAGKRHPEGCLLRRLAADVSGPQASGTGWLPSLEAAGYMAERPSVWSVQGGHILSEAALGALIAEIGDGAATGSVLVGEAGPAAEAAVGEALALSGFGILAWEPLGPVAERLGRPLSLGDGEAADRGFFLAKKMRLSLKQEDNYRNEIFRAEEDAGEEGFSDAP